MVTRETYRPDTWVKAGGSAGSFYTGINTELLKYFREGNDVMPEEQLVLYREGVKAYGDVAPTYHIELVKIGS